jgi:hypothetical protein
MNTENMSEKFSRNNSGDARRNYWITNYGGVITTETSASSFKKGWDASWNFLQSKIDELEKELHQQRFNNKHNLSIDQKIADKIESQRKEIDELVNSFGKIENYLERGEIFDYVYCAEVIFPQILKITNEALEKHKRGYINPKEGGE